MESTNGIIGSTHCIKLRQEMVTVDDFWVDPNRDDAIVAWETRHRLWQFFVTIDYRRDPKYGWLPIGWTQTSPRPSGLARFENTVTHLAINEHIAEPMFTLEFPAGTNSFDWTTHERYLIASDHTKTIVAKWDSTASQRVAQTLEDPAYFSIEAKPLKDALERIGRQYDFPVVIDPAVIRAGVDPTMKVKPNARRVKLEEVLTGLLKQAPKPLAYKWKTAF